MSEQKHDKLREFVRSKIRTMERSPVPSKAALAELRRAVGKSPAEVPQVWNITFEGLPEELFVTSGEIRPAEWAIHVAMTCYALHQRGKELDAASVHEENVNFGEALAKLQHQSSHPEGIRRRFASLLKAEGIREIAYHLRGLIQLLASGDTRFDYGMLAQDLYFLQFPEGSERVRLNWGRSYYRVTSYQANQKEEFHESVNDR